MSVNDNSRIVIDDSRMRFKLWCNFYDNHDDLNMFLRQNKLQHTNITTNYNQYLLRHCLQKLVKTPKSEAWVWKIKNLQNRRSGAQRLKSKLTTC